jgi:hypothetical protein
LEVQNCNLVLDPDVLPAKLEVFRQIRDCKCTSDFGVGAFPSSTKKITLNDHFNQPLLPGLFTGGLEILEFGERFNKSIDRGVLPSTLKILRFGKCFNRNMLPGVLPEGLEELEFGLQYKAKMSVDVLPSTLQRIKLPTGYRFALHEVIPSNCYVEYFQVVTKNPWYKEHELRLDIEEIEYFQTCTYLRTLYI